MDKPVVIARFSYPHEAHMAKSSLESAGIPAAVVDEHMINMQWLYSDALGGVKLLVAPEYAEQALGILNSDFSTEVDCESGSDETVCPLCGGKNFHPFTKGRVPAFIVFLLLGFPLFFYKHGLKCTDCGHFWKP